MREELRRRKRGILSTLDVPLLPTASFGESTDFAFQPIHLSMGVSRSLLRSPMPSAPKASFTPSKRPMFNDTCVLDVAGAWTKALAHEDVAAAAATRILVFIILLRV
jgi:hypothetical protein